MPRHQQFTGITSEFDPIIFEVNDFECIFINQKSFKLAYEILQNIRPPAWLLSTLPCLMMNEGQSNGSTSQPSCFVTRVLFNNMNSRHGCQHSNIVASSPKTNSFYMIRTIMCEIFISVRWHEHHGISHHCQLNCLFNSVFGLTPEKTSG